MAGRGEGRAEEKGSQAVREKAIPRAGTGAGAVAEVARDRRWDEIRWRSCR